MKFKIIVVLVSTLICLSLTGYAAEAQTSLQKITLSYSSSGMPTVDWLIAKFGHKVSRT